MRDVKETGCTKSNSGFTLVETLIALFLLVVALIPLAAILTGTMRQATVSKVRNHAREIAASERDKAKSLTFNAIGVAGGTTTFNNPSSNNNDKLRPESAYTQSALADGPETQTYQNYTYTIRRDVRKSVDQYSGNTATKKVIITVSWTNPSPGGSVSLTTEIGPTAMAP